MIHLLSGHLRRSYGNQYRSLEQAVAEEFQQRGESSGMRSLMGGEVLSPKDSDLLLEIFWDLFRQGIITLGLDSANPAFPFFRVSGFGRQVLANQDPYFFHDLKSYEAIVNQRIPGIDKTTLLYMKEAMQAFLSGCLLSSSVMLGVAIEDAFEGLIEAVDANPKTQQIFKSLQKERTILRRFNRFQSILENHLDLLSQATREDLSTNFGGILSLIRNFRNESGHPSGRLISREQAYVNLHLFIPCCKKIYELRQDLGSS
ncbi:MAG TPA: hypothetical protein VF179_26325 [Thermoanaerobaculia bacterium]|nr:hypothetical protein [Thermoanaerobaculia bacterium]